MGKRSAFQAVAHAVRTLKDAEDERELALLDEFSQSPSVAELAERIARRLGRRTSPNLLIEKARLSTAIKDSMTRGN